MCSNVDAPSTPVTVSGLARLVERAQAATRAVSAAVAADPSLLAEVPDELLESLTLRMLDARDATGSVSTVLVGRVERRIGGVKGKLVAGAYPSTARFLEREAGMSATESRVMVARGKELDSHSTVVADAWLAGDIPGGAIRDLTRGVSEWLRRSSRTDTRAARAEALDTLMPVARTGRVDRVRRELAEMRVTADHDGADEKALAAFEHQTLSIVEVGEMTHVTGWLTLEAGAATKTVLEHAAAQIAVEELGEVSRDADCEEVILPGVGCSCGELDRARRAAGMRHDQLYARALGEVMTDRLDAGGLGSHHRVAPHLTIVSDVTDAAAPLLGRLALPGGDDGVLLPPATMSRLLCDADVTRVLTTTSLAPIDADHNGSEPVSRSQRYLGAVRTRLTAEARSVLYVGRYQRTVSARLRRALEVRDEHCAFPGCRARVARCHAHHVVPWEDDGPTDLPNLALLCVAHHHARHEGGWTMRLRPGATGHEAGCWEFTPPPLRRRRLRP